MDRPSHPTNRLFFAAIAQPAAWHHRAFCIFAVALSALSEPLFADNGGSPAGMAASTAADRIYLISTRSIGTHCDCSYMSSGLRCEELVHDDHGAARWYTVHWHDVAAELAEPLTTVVYIHGNRVDPGADKSHGLELYRSLSACNTGGSPIRFIIWSWPSSKVPGIVKDYQVKAARTKPVAWQLAWALDQMPVETPLTLVGHSYGGRVVTGALHLLAGGPLGDLQLAERIHPDRPPVRAALLAAAVDAAWIRPGGYHGRALEQVDQLLLVNNHLDPAMRFYHLAFEGRGRPLGYDGIGRSSLGEFAGRIRSIDVTPAVGRRHALEDYLTHSRRIADELQQVVNLPPPENVTGVLADH
jgi:hypothetical protein